MISNLDALFKVITFLKRWLKFIKIQSYACQDLKNGLFFLSLHNDEEKCFVSILVSRYGIFPDYKEENSP